MKYRNLGKWGLKLSEVSIGTMYYGSYIPKEQAIRCLKEAVDQGINYIDSADRYGIFDSELPMEERTRAEIVLGEFIKDYDRSDLVIGSKVWYQMDEKNPNSGGLGRKHIREGIRESLKYLGTDYLDIYYCHRPDRNTPLEETILTMSNLIDEGLINYWGTSWWSPSLVERTIGIAKLLGAHPPHVEQPPYHMFARFIETQDEIIDIAAYHGIGLVTFEALATGLFTGKYQNEIPSDSRYATTSANLPPDVHERYKKVLPPLMEIADELEITMAQLAIAWTLRHKEVTTSLTGASKPEQIAANVLASEITLKNDVLDRIDEIMDNKPRNYYR
ncbi:MAG: aldo/keto reductase [Candidatus Hermodarchaeota archaeon]